MAQLTHKDFVNDFFAHKISSRVIPLLSMCSSATSPVVLSPLRKNNQQILITALCKCPTSPPPLTTTTAYQLGSLWDSQTRDMHLLSNFRILDRLINMLTVKAALLIHNPSINGFGSSDLGSDSMLITRRVVSLATIHQKWLVENYM